MLSKRAIASDNMFIVVNLQLLQHNSKLFLKLKFNNMAAEHTMHQHDSINDDKRKQNFKWKTYETKYKI